MNPTPAIGIIGGSGLYEIDSLTAISRHTIDTPFGPPSDEIIAGTLSGRTVYFLPRHGKGHRLLAHEINHRANIWALRSLGVRWLISVTAVGSLCEEMAPRHVVIPDQLIDRTGRAHEHTYFGHGIAAHITFADPYSQEMRSLLSHATSLHTPSHHPTATYLSMNGPAFSTRAESLIHRTLGAHLIGMTNAPEARLAREAEIAMATLALVTDYDSWKTDEPPVNVASLLANLHANSHLAKNIIRTTIPTIPHTPTYPAHTCLDHAILTPQSAWPTSQKQALHPILQRFF